MRDQIQPIKDLVLRLTPVFLEIGSRKATWVTQIRVKIIVFSDGDQRKNQISASEFFTTTNKQGVKALSEFILKIESEPVQGGTPRPGLEALAVAMASDWVQDGDRQRHIIVMFTDASAHRLEDRVGDIPATYAAQVPTSLDELTAIWEGDHNKSSMTTTLKQNKKRLVLFAPDTYPWSNIGDNWSDGLWLPSKAGEELHLLDRQEMDSILHLLLR